MKLLYSTSTKCVTFLDTKDSTVRCSDCELLVHVDLLVDNDAPCCGSCMHYRSTLRALVSRSEKRNTSESYPTDPNSHTPFRHLNTPEKARRYQRNTAYEDPASGELLVNNCLQLHKRQGLLKTRLFMTTSVKL